MQNYLLKIPVILLFGAVFMFACDEGGEENPDYTTIEYTLASQEAGKSANIVYTSLWGTEVILEDEALPWSTSIKVVFKYGDALSFTAESGDQGEMTARIIVDDEVVATETAVHLIELDYINGLK